jgi:hypothetical protein
VALCCMTLKKQRIGRHNHPVRFPTPVLFAALLAKGNITATLQSLIQNGPLVAWAFAALFTGFTMVTDKV